MLNWADAHGVGYEAWTWDTWGNCSSLISDFNGTPANSYGSYVRSHYLAGP
jgi:endoglucanase